MGLFTKGTAEPVCCGFCGREIKAPKLFITRTMFGKAVCAKCLTERHLGDIQDKLPDLPDEEIALFLDDMEENEDEYVLHFKNMSATEMNFDAAEITERFVRGDLSRNTEGSGLGLAIAQSFTEMQNCKFEVQIDGDLFKVNLRFHKKEE